MTVLLGFVRHGVTEWNEAGRAQGQTDIELSDRGREQAKALASVLSAGAWDALYTSDLSRAADTAKLLAEHAALGEVKLDARLRERSFGPLEGLTRKEQAERWGENPLSAAGVERLEDVVTRGRSFVNDVTARHSGQSVIAVSHGAFIRIMLAELLKQEAPDGWLDNATMTLVRYDGAAWKLLLYSVK